MLELPLTFGLCERPQITLHAVALALLFLKTLPSLLTWKLDQGLEVIPPSVALPSCSELPLLDSSSGNPC